MKVAGVAEKPVAGFVAYAEWRNGVSRGGRTKTEEERFEVFG